MLVLVDVAEGVGWDVAHASRRAVPPFLATCFVGAPALLLGGGMPARMPAQHAESVRHVAVKPSTF